MAYYMFTLFKAHISEFRMRHWVIVVPIYFPKYGCQSRACILLHFEITEQQLRWCSGQEVMTLSKQGCLPCMFTPFYPFSLDKNQEDKFFFGFLMENCFFRPIYILLHSHAHCDARLEQTIIVLLLHHLMKRTRTATQEGATTFLG